MYYNHTRICLFRSYFRQGRSSTTIAGNHQLQRYRDLVSHGQHTGECELAQPQPGEWLAGERKSTKRAHQNKSCWPCGWRVYRTYFLYIRVRQYAGDRKPDSTLIKTCETHLPNRLLKENLARKGALWPVQQMRHHTMELGQWSLLMCNWPPGA